MPIIGLGLHFAAAVFFAIHAVRSGQDRYWLLILFMFPVLGSVVYAVAVWLPEQRGSVHGQRAVRLARETIDPNRQLRQAREALEVSDTTATRLHFAEALLAAGRPAEAAEQYRVAKRGVHRDDPHLDVRQAGALLAAQQAPQARALLEALIAQHPDFRSPEGHLTYARAVAACGDRAAARTEFDALIGYFPGLEAHAHYAEALHGWGEDSAAAALCAEALQRSRRMPAHARTLNREWTRRLRRVADATGAAV